MSRVTKINTYIASGMNMGKIAEKYYSTVKPDKKYNADQARNLFVRDPNLDFKVLRDCVNIIYSEQINLLNDAENALR